MTIMICSCRVKGLKGLKNDTVPIYKFTMIFGDSFFENSEKEEGPSKSPEKKLYKARYCERNWYLEFSQHSISEAPGSIHDMTFMTMKHTAALFYYEKNYRESARLYKELLGLVPKENACVTRELKDALARSLVKIGEAEAALKKVEELVAPPRSNDWSAWGLLAQCHRQLHNVEAEINALQQCILLQRSHASFWVDLARAYGDLPQQWSGKPMTGLGIAGESSHEEGTAERTEQDDCPSHNNCGKSIKFATGDFFSRTVLLFRPYVSWRRDLDDSCTSKVNSNTSNLCCSELDALNEAPHQHCSADFPVELQSASHRCTELCLLSEVALSRDDGKSSFSYLSLITGAIREVEDSPSQPESMEVEKCAASSTSLQHLCFEHSIFVVLVRGFVSSDDLAKALEQMKFEHSSSILDQFCDMAQCCCLMWARQLLLYSARYSTSFPKGSVESQLLEVEAMLDKCPQSIVSYIKIHFTKRTVFDEGD